MLHACVQKFNVTKNLEIFFRTKQGGSVDKTQDRKGVRTTIPDASYYSPKICVQQPNIRQPYAALVPSATGRPRRPCRGRFEKENTAGSDGEIVLHGR